MKTMFQRLIRASKLQRRSDRTSKLAFSKESATLSLSPQAQTSNLTLNLLTSTLLILTSLLVNKGLGQTYADFSISTGASGSTPGTDQASTTSTPGFKQYSWTVPAGISTVMVEVWGAGGGGTGRISTSYSGAGGGGGAYARKYSYNVSGGSTVLAIQVGYGGAANGGSNQSAGNGGTSYVKLTNHSGTTIASAGGGVGGKNGTTGQLVGSGAGSTTYSILSYTTNDDYWYGGNGEGVSGTRGGGGGGGAGSGASGSNGGSSLGVGGSGGLNETALFTGLSGGNGATCGSGSTAAQVGNVRGGGASGGGNNSSTTGAAGGAGFVRITYTVAPTTFYSKTNFSNTDANNLSNWNSNTDGISGSAPSSFTTAGQTLIIQNGHQYKVTGAWTGSSSSIIQVNSGGALDINAQTLSTWQRIDIAGTGVSSSGALFNSSASASDLSIPVALTGNSTIQTGTGGIIYSGTINLNSYTLTFGGSNSTSVSGVISGSGNLVKAGSGALTLSGSNTYTGTTTINNGTLSAGTIVVAGSASNLGNASTAVVLGTASAKGTLSYTGGATTFTRGFTVNAGGGGITNTTANLLTIGTGGISNGGTLTFSNTSSGGTTITSVISSTGSVEINNSGSGATTLSGANSYSGGTVIIAGTLKLGAAGGATNTPLGTIGSGTTVSTTGATLDLAGFTLGTAEALTLNGTGVSNGGALMNSGAAVTYSGLINLASSSSIVGGTGTINISNVGTITGPGFGLTLGGAQGGTMASILGTGAGTLTKQDAGTWTLTGANNYTGATTINAGILSISSSERISNSSNLILGGGTFSTGSSTGYSETLGTLTLSASSSINLGTGSHILTFSASNLVNWTGSTTLTISGWTGSAGATGTAGKIYVGSSASGLTSAQLDQITFSGYGAAMQLGTGEIVPASNYYSKSTGNLELTSSWGSKSDGSGTAPSNFTSNGVSYIISNNSTPTIGANWTVSGTGSKIVIGDGTNACNFTVPSTLTVTSPATDVSNNGTITRTTSGANSWGTLTFASGAKYVHNVSGGGTLPTATWNSNSTLQLDQSVNDNEFTESFGNVVINGSSSFIMRTSGSAITINGNLTYNSSGSIGVSSSTNALTMSVGGNIVHSGSVSVSYMANLGNDVTVNVSGNYSQSNGTAYLSNYYNDGSMNITGDFLLSSGSYILNSDQGTSFSRINNLNIDGNFNMSSGTLDLSQESSSFASSSVASYLYVAGNFSHTGGVITETAGQSAVITYIILDGVTGNQTLESTGQSNNIRFNVAGSNAQCVVAASKTFVQSANTTFIVAAGTSTPDLLINGTFTRTGTSLTTSGTMSVASGGTYQHNCNGQSLPSATWDAASTCNITGTSSTTPTNFGQTFGNLTVNCSGTATTDANSTVAGNLTVTGGTLIVGNNFTLGITGNSSITGTLTLGGTGAKTFSGNATINPSGTLTVSGSGAYSLAGNCTNNGTFTPGTAILTLNGGGAQTLDGTSALSFSNVTINKTGGTLTAQKDMTITGTLTLTNGILDMNSKTLTMGSASANGTITGGSASSYIVALDGGTPSKLIHRVNSTSNSTYSFPIGTGSKYTPVTVVMKGGTLSNASIQVWTKNSMVTGMNNNVSCRLNRSWFVEPTGTITNPAYDIQLGFASGDFAGSAGFDLNPVKLSSGIWYKPSGSMLENGTTQGTTIATSYASPSTPTTSSGIVYWNSLTSFSEFGGAGGSAPLPVELVSFNGDCEDGVVNLSWQTASEHNSSHFDVEKSRDGESWQVIETIPAAGNSNQLLSYEAFDQVSNILNYYRLNQVDIDGKNKRYDPIAVSCEAMQNGIFMTYPNPSNEGFNILINDKALEGEMNMNIYTATGSKTLQKQIVVKEGINVFMVNEKLLPGLYFIELNDQNNKTKVIKHLVN